MTVNRHKYFRWTPRTAWITFAYAILVPAMLGTAGYMTDVGCVKRPQTMWANIKLGQVGHARQEARRFDLGVLSAESSQRSNKGFCVYICGKLSARLKPLQCRTLLDGLRSYGHAIASSVRLRSMAIHDRQRTAQCCSERVQLCHCDCKCSTDIKIQEANYQNWSKPVDC